MKKSLLILAALLCYGGSAFGQATNVYVTPSGTATGSCPAGTTGAPNLTPSGFNTSGNWGSSTGKIGAGTTVLVCGTFTGTAGQQLLAFQGNGTSGSPITLLFDTGTNLTAPYWSISGAITTAGHNFLVIDGGSNGTIQNTANGSSPTFANQQPTIAVNVSGSSNVTVQHLTVANICQHTSTSDTNGCTSGGVNDRAVLISGGATNVTIQLNTIHDAENCIEYSGSGTDTGVAFVDNTISHCNWGIDGFGSSNGLTISGNDISSATNWDDSADHFHHNGVILFPQGGAKMNNVVFAINYIHDINGDETGHIFLDPDSGSAADIPSVLIYNNVLTTTTLNGPTNAFITVGVGVSNAKVYNNTISGKGAQGISGDVASTWFNNIVSGSADAMVTNHSPSGFTSNWNDFFLSTGSQIFITNSVTTNNQFTGLAAWITATGLDSPNSFTANPNLSASFTLNSGSPAIGTGTNLTSLGIAGLDVGAPQFFGIAFSCGTGCIARLSTGPWDIGAYPFAATATVAIPTFSPVAGTYGSSQPVTISDSTSGATICYTTDGSTPTANGAGTCTHGTTYSSAVTVSSSLTIKAVGSLSGDLDSSVGSAAYVIAPLVATPTFSPIAGVYGGAQSVTISTSTGGATICYTTDGSTPTANGAGTCTHGTTYTVPVSVPSSLTLKAVGSLSGDTDSSVGSASYVIGSSSVAPAIAAFMQ